MLTKWWTERGATKTEWPDLAILKVTSSNKSSQNICQLFGHFEKGNFWVATLWAIFVKMTTFDSSIWTHCTKRSYCSVPWHSKWSFAQNSLSPAASPTFAAGWSCRIAHVTALARSHSSTCTWPIPSLQSQSDQGASSTKRYDLRFLCSVTELRLPNRQHPCSSDCARLS